MNRHRHAAAGCILGAALAASAVQAQEVHKCTLNAQVTYQAKPCATRDVVVPIQSGPSDEELIDAKRDLGRQRVQAMTGRLYTPPRPAPAGVIIQRAQDASTTTTTTETTKVTVNANSVFEQTRTTRTTRATRTTMPAPLPAPAPPKNNCETLNRDNAEAVDRRDELRAPGELQSRQELLANLQAQIDRIQGLAQASNCRLTR